MNYLKLERVLLWFLTILMLIMFIVTERSNMSLLEMNESLLNMVDSSRDYYNEYMEESRTQIENLKVENVQLKMQIEEMEEK